MGVCLAVTLDHDPLFIDAVGVVNMFGEASPFGQCPHGAVTLMG
ncbi:MAG: hypothetical protein K0S58_654 [Nitrospira sp.]|nr:hypothetical protein [Nitrospira sp.]